jgi:hypothetical protein
MTVGQKEWMKMEGDTVKIEQEEGSSEDSDEDMSSSSDVEVIKEVAYEGNKLVDSIGTYPRALKYCNTFACSTRWLAVT